MCVELIVPGTMKNIVPVDLRQNDLAMNKGVPMLWR